MTPPALGSPDRPLRVAIVGAGPSGFYAAAALLGSAVEVEVDLLDRLPVPYGLVRGGVAPDHQKIKSVVRAYAKTAADPRFRFFGNVHVGRQVPLEVLRAHYDVLCFAIGCESARRLGIPGEDLAGSGTATDFVAWYNGHPDARDLDFPLETVESVVVVGVGNVAIDVARILTRDPASLHPTDIADHALERLRASRVRDVVLLGRRGPAQAAFTPAELQELSTLDGVDLLVPPESAELDPASAAWLEAHGDKVTRRNVELLRELSQREPTGAPRRIHLWLCRSPVAVEGEGRVEAVQVARNALVEEGGRIAAVPTGAVDRIDAQMVLAAVGYCGVPLPGLPFDRRRGVVPNVEGRVVDETGAIVPGTYVVGWAKRGPSGVIGTNRADAVETIDRLLADVAGRHAPSDPRRTAEAAEAALAAAVPQLVRWTDWERIDAEERARGEAQGRVRRKFTAVEDMLDLVRRI